jgi:hypothetical protein
MQNMHALQLQVKGRHMAAASGRPVLAGHTYHARAQDLQVLEKL